MCSVSEANKALTDYYKDKIVLKRAETKKIIEVAQPIIDYIVKYISDHDNRFSCQETTVGSYYQHLKVKTANEFDLNIPLVYSGEYKWGANDVALPSNDWHFDFSQTVDKKLKSTTLQKDLTVVKKNSKDSDFPGAGYFRMRIPPKYGSVDYNSLSCEGYIIPYMVQSRLKELMLEAVDKYKKDKKVTIAMNREAHGPASTISFEVQLADRKETISVDFSVVLRSSLSFKPPASTCKIDWPRSATFTMARNIGTIMKDQVDKIVEQGISVVPKHNFYWYLSFAVCEKMMCIHIDGDGGCRKMVQRIMKDLLKREWCPGADPVISSYELKTVWLWECENHPNGNDWKKEKVSERFFDCIRRLVNNIEEGQLTHYFVPGINLLENKKPGDLGTVKGKLNKFLTSSFSIKDYLE